MDKDFDVKRFADSYLRNQVEGLEELTDDLRANVYELEKQLNFVANCLAQSEECFMPKEFSCSYRTPYGLYCHAEKAIRLNCIYCRAKEAAKQADMEVEDADRSRRVGTSGDPKSKWEPKPGELVAVFDYRDRVHACTFSRSVNIDGTTQYFTKEPWQTVEVEWRYCEPVRKHFDIPDEE